MDINREYTAGVLRRRNPEMHKGDAGHILIAAGSAGMTGAAVLSALGAFRAGAGLVYMYVPSEIFHILQIRVPEVICLDRKEKTDYGRYEAIVFGPGLRTGEDTRDLLSDILADYKGSLLIDADGLNVIAKYDMYDEIESSSASIVYTPHEGEASRHVGGEGSRIERAERLTGKLRGVTVLKGSRTIVADGERMMFNTSGNPGMAKAGSGDVLSGIAGALLGQGYDPFEAAACSVYIHGLAGDMAASERGQWGIMATDIADKASEAIKYIIGE